MSVFRSWYSLYVYFLDNVKNMPHIHRELLHHRQKRQLYNERCHSYSVLRKYIEESEMLKKEKSEQKFL